ncbi:apolipo protein O-domain-containing protein [Podospora appendiculata]|uniref:MICOS complex subunit n=1 Tax=Podospora appendiculata TaxID=314037 RepID=A0AAE1CIA8_9PEZI|nr:apolipo protein O-domain-containing protein [Podospora appendiculata]
MAARVLFQRRAAPLTAAVLVGSIAFYPRVALAEAPGSNHSSRKPIYDDVEGLESAFPSAPKPTATTPPAAQTPAPAAAAAVPSSVAEAIVPSLATTTPSSELTARHRAPTPTERLAAQIRRGRLFLYEQACAAEDSVNVSMARAFALEQSFTSTIASLAPPRESGEKLMPGAVYVLVAGMAGSIVARNRNVLLRGSLPLALGVGAAWVVVPVTMRNVSELLWTYEQKVPAVADAHLRTREGIEQGWSFARVHANLAVRKIEESVTDARQTVEGWVRKGK